MLRQEMEALSELEMQEAIASKWFGCVLVVCLMALAMYLIYCWYKGKLAEEAARVSAARWRTKQTDIAWKRLQESEADQYRASLKKKDEEIQRLQAENRKLQVRLDTLTKAKPQSLR